MFNNNIVYDKHLENMDYMENVNAKEEQVRYYYGIQGNNKDERIKGKGD